MALLWECLLSLLFCLNCYYYVIWVICVFIVIDCVLLTVDHSLHHSGAWGRLVRPQKKWHLPPAAKAAIPRPTSESSQLRSGLASRGLSARVIPSGSTQDQSAVGAGADRSRSERHSRGSHGQCGYDAMVTGMELDFNWGYLGRWGFNIRLAIIGYNDL